MSDNVLILGAGFSYDAGIPLMGGFANRMWELHSRGSHNLKPLSSEDRALFEQVQKIRAQLDGYHGRASFDDRNIEDLLSILSFDELGKKRGKSGLSLMSKAIARTIELTCNVKTRGGPMALLTEEDTGNSAHYERLWEILMEVFSTGGARKMPTILTFNYDLVLERSLHNLFNSARYMLGQLPFESLQVSYHAGDISGATFEPQLEHYARQGVRRILKEGTALMRSQAAGRRHWNIDILKLHGSVNFPREKQAANAEMSLTDALDDPFIMPPVFNKLQGENRLGMWQKGLEALRTAKNVVIVGYSLPTTDIYMQYFLKSALGPNKELQKIIVFDPVLSADGPAAIEMKARYADCFSPQLKSRICFDPTSLHPHGQYSSGSTSHFLEIMAANHSALLF